MNDKLTDRLRGRYKVGPDNVYGPRSFTSFIPPIALEAADRIEELEQALLEIWENADNFELVVSIAHVARTKDQ